MSMFQNLKQLISHCKFCVICQKERTYSFIAEPSYLFSIKNDKLVGEELFLYTQYNYPLVNEEDLEDGQYQPKIRFNIDFKIDIINNTFKSIINPSLQEPIDFSQKEECMPHFFISGYCRQCNSGVDSDYITLDPNKNLLKDFRLNEESFYLSGEGKSFKVLYNYFLENMNIYNLQDVHHKMNTESIYPIDFSNKEKALSTIKTLLIFS